MCIERGLGECWNGGVKRTLGWMAGEVGGGAGERTVQNKHESTSRISNNITTCTLALNGWVTVAETCKTNGGTQIYGRMLFIAVQLNHEYRRFLWHMSCKTGVLARLRSRHLRESTILSGNHFTSTASYSTMNISCFETDFEGKIIRFNHFCEVLSLHDMIKL